MAGPYDVLEIKAGASISEIRQAYLILVQVWHPDRFSDPDLKSVAENKLKEITEAFRTLETLHQAGAAISDSPEQSRPHEPAPRSQMVSKQRVLFGALVMASLLGGAVMGIFLFRSLSVALGQLNGILGGDAAPIAGMGQTANGWRAWIPTPWRRPEPANVAPPEIPKSVNVTRSNVPAPSSSPQRFSPPGVGEIVIHNQADAAVAVALIGTRSGRSVLRTFAVPATADARIGNLGPDNYILEFSFPYTSKLRVGPLAIVQVATAKGSTADRYEVTVTPEAQASAVRNWK